jgi:hypothetical protein
MAKTPKSVKELLQRHEEAINWFSEIVHLFETSPDNIQPWIKAKGKEHYESMAEGQNAMMENILFVHKCYAGFMYQSLPKFQYGAIVRYSVDPKSPEFKEWRRSYYTNT